MPKITYKDNGFTKKNQKILEIFKKEKNVFKAKKKNCVTQLYYAKKGIVTPEMEYVSIRENELRKKLDKKNFQKNNFPQITNPKHVWKKSLEEEQLSHLI